MVRELAAKWKCGAVEICIQREPLFIDFFLLPLEGCDGVLGTAQWLQLLGPIWWDFSKLLMCFTRARRETEWKGNKLPGIKWWTAV